MSEHNVPSIIGCDDAPIFSAADIFQTLTSCEECEALCWQVVDCEDPENILCTSEQSGANPDEWAVLTGKVIRFQDINDDNKEKCGFVTQGRCIDLSCDFINIPVVECFDDCDSCKIIPKEVTFNFTQRTVYPGYDTPACTPEVYDKTKCEWSESLYQKMVSDRYGLEICCETDAQKWHIKNELIDLAAIHNPQLEEEISNCDCFYYYFYNLSNSETATITGTTDCDGNPIDITLSPTTIYILCQSEEQHAAGTYTGIGRIEQVENCCDNPIIPAPCSTLSVTGLGRLPSITYFDCQTGQQVTTSIPLFGTVIVLNVNLSLPYFASNATVTLLS